VVLDISSNFIRTALVTLQWLTVLDERFGSLLHSYYTVCNNNFILGKYPRNVDITFAVDNCLQASVVQHSSVQMS
jgi:hypothetical protein